MRNETKKKCATNVRLQVKVDEEEDEVFAELHHRVADVLLQLASVVYLGRIEVAHVVGRLFH